MCNLRSRSSTLVVSVISSSRGVSKPQVWGISTTLRWSFGGGFISHSFGMESSWRCFLAAQSAFQSCCVMERMALDEEMEG